MSSLSRPSTDFSMYDYKAPINERIHIPVQHRTNNTSSTVREPYSPNPVSSKDTTVQWLNDPSTGREKYRMKINIEGFNRDDVRIRVDGNKLFVYGERIENKSQGTSKKIIEKHYDLPSDVDKSRPSVTFPTSATMQVEFPSKHLPSRSSEYIPTRKSNASHIYDRKEIANPRIHSSEKRNSTVPIHRVSIISKGSSHRPSQAYNFRPSMDHSIIDKIDNVDKKIATSLHRPKRSASPALSHITEEGHVTSSSSSDTDSTLSNNEPSGFPSDFNSDVFYKSVFQPEIFTDDRKQRYIDMKLDMQDYNPDQIKVSINENDLIVHVQNTNFYKQITLPSNADLSSLSIHHHHDKKLYMTIKLLDEHSSFRYI